MLWKPRYLGFGEWLFNTINGRSKEETDRIGDFGRVRNRRFPLTAGGSSPRLAGLIVGLRKKAEQLPDVGEGLGDHHDGLLQQSTPPWRMAECIYVVVLPRKIGNKSLE